MAWPISALTSGSPVCMTWARRNVAWIRVAPADASTAAYALGTVTAVAPTSAQRTTTSSATGGGIANGVSPAVGPSVAISSSCVTAALPVGQSAAAQVIVNAAPVRGIALRRASSAGASVKLSPTDPAGSVAVNGGTWPPPPAAWTSSTAAVSDRNRGRPRRGSGRGRRG